MEKKLLLLGLLLNHEMHGYQLNEMLRQNPSTPISLKKSNAYKLLSDMEKDGWISHYQEQDGNRPQRRVYQVTEQGEKNFYKLLRENLSSAPMPEFPGLVGLDFLFMLSKDEASLLLEKRLHFVVERRKQLEEIPDEIRKTHLASDYLYQYYVYQVDWLTTVIKELEKEESAG